jgi:hypothetical protein
MLRLHSRRTTAWVVLLGPTTASWPASSGTALSTATVNTLRCRPYLGCTYDKRTRPAVAQHTPTLGAYGVLQGILLLVHSQMGPPQSLVLILQFAWMRMPLLLCPLAGHWQHPDYMGYSYGCRHEPFPGFCSDAQYRTQAGTDQQAAACGGNQASKCTKSLVQ